MSRCVLVRDYRTFTIRDYRTFTIAINRQLHHKPPDEFKDSRIESEAPTEALQPYSFHSLPFSGLDSSECQRAKPTHSH